MTGFWNGLTPNHIVSVILLICDDCHDPLTCTSFPAIIPESSRQRARYWILNELNSDLSVSRPHSRLQWGIPVPDDNSQTVCKVVNFDKPLNLWLLKFQIYVWLDALINYLTTSHDLNSSSLHTKSHAINRPNLHGNLWPATNQIVGKDILRFHAVYWPAFLMAAQLPLPQRLISHAHWTIGKSKVS